MLDDQGNTINPYDFPFPDYGDEQTLHDVIHTCVKMYLYFSSHDSICISVSGGSDSDCIVHLVCTYFPEYLDKCHFVFVNTGLEYAATKRHLTDLEQRYSIQIQRIRGESVVSVVRKYGVPILNKLKSHVLNQYMRDVPSAKKYIFMDGYKVKRLQFTKNQRVLADYLKDNKIWVSDKCCDLSKKKPLYKYININGIDLNCTGEREAEGGNEQWLTNPVLKRAIMALTSICRFGGGRTKQSRYSKIQRAFAILIAMKYTA